VNIEPPPPPPPPEARPIDERTGFFFQGGLGVGYGSYRDEYVGQDVYLGVDGTETASGIGSTLNLRLGGGLASGMVLGGGLVTLAGTFDFEDRSTDGTTTEEELDASAVALLLFFQKYIGPFFLRAELGILSVAAEGEDPAGGFGFGLGTGADFLVSRNWAIGFGVNFHRGAGEYDESDYRGEASLNAFTAHFTATYF
jgi:hypothetical protein